MFIFNDKLYTDGNGNYYTKEYFEHRGNFDGKVWRYCNKETELKSADDIRYEYGSGKVIHCNYDQLFRDNDSLILCNEIMNYGQDAYEHIELENGTDYDEENDRYEEICQYYIIDDGLADSLKRHTDEIVYYHEKLDIYILGVTHWGTAWDYVGAEYKL